MRKTQPCLTAKQRRAVAVLADTTPETVARFVRGERVAWRFRWPIRSALASLNIATGTGEEMRDAG